MVLMVVVTMVEAAGSESIALGLIDDLKAGRSVEAHARLGKVASAAINPDALLAAWRQGASPLGAWKSTELLQQFEQRGMQVFVHAVRFEKGGLEVTTAVDPKQQKAEGFFLKPLPSDAKPVQATPAAYVRPDAFTSADVTVGKAPWALPGTLTLPKGKGPFAALVLVHGSGPNDRDETIGATRPFKDLAEGLATMGIAVLRYDKRTLVHGKEMVGKPVGVEEEVMLDALAAVELLAARPEVDPKRVWLLGHSLGAQLAPELGARAKQVKGVVLLAPPARMPWESIPQQLRHVGADAKMLAEVDAACAALKSGSAKGALLGAPASYWLEVAKHDGVAAAKKLGKPLLVMFGERDYQVTFEDAAAWKKGLEGVALSQVWVVPKANHLFVEGEGVSMPAEYAQPGHVAVDVVTRIAAVMTAEQRKTP